MQNKNIRPFIALAILVVAVAVVWAAWPKQKTPEQNNNQLQAQDMIPENLIVVPTTGTIVSYDNAAKLVEFKVKDETYTGRVTDKTLIIKQAKDKTGAMTVQPGKVTDIVKNAKVMVVPAPKNTGAYDLTEIQIVK